MIKFNSKVRSLFIFILFSVFLFSCASTPEQMFPNAKMIQCASSKPQVCTREYRPVCGFENDGNHKTFSNACTACSSSKVTSYCEGDCNELKSLSK